MKNQINQTEPQKPAWMKVATWVLVPIALIMLVALIVMYATDSWNQLGQSIWWQPIKVGLLILAPVAIIVAIASIIWWCRSPSKKVITAIMIFSLISLPLQRTEANTILICIVAVVIAGGAIIMVKKCGTTMILAYEEDEDGNRKYFCTEAAMVTMEKNGWKPCQGRFAKGDQECAQRAQIANTNRWMIHCGPIASTPKQRVILEKQTQATNSNGTVSFMWVPVAEQRASAEDNWSFAIVPNSSATNYLSNVRPKEDGALTDAELVGQSVIVESSGESSGFFRVRFEE